MLVGTLTEQLFSAKGWRVVSASRQPKHVIVDLEPARCSAICSGCGETKRRIHDVKAAEAPDESTSLHKDLTVLAAVALRAGRRAREGGRFTARLTQAWRAASEAFAALGATIEEMHAGPEPTTDHPDPA